MHLSPTFRRTVTLAVMLAVVLVPATRAMAQTSGERTAAAQALFEEAMRLMKEDQTAAACPKLEESQRLDPGMGTQFRLAECYEKMGRTASAWATFVAVADSAAAAQRPDREAVARKRADALAPQVPRLAITVPPALAAIAGLEVQRDGTAVGQPLWGVLVPIDPGEHVVTAAAPGKKTWYGKVTAAGAAVLTVTVEPLQDVAPPPPPPPAPPPHRSLVPGVVLGVVAAAGVATGGALVAVHAGHVSDAGALSRQIKAAGGLCVPGAAGFSSQCSALASKASGADAIGNASTVAFAAGGAAAVAAVVYLLWPAAKPGPVSTGAVARKIFPAAGECRRGFAVAGSF
jgi:hypothetical protein